MTFTEVAHDLSIRYTLIHNWKQAFEANGTLTSDVVLSVLRNNLLKRFVVKVREHSDKTRAVGSAPLRFSQIVTLGLSSSAEGS